MAAVNCLFSSFEAILISPGNVMSRNCDKGNCVVLFQIIVFVDRRSYLVICRYYEQGDIYKL